MQQIMQRIRTEDSVYDLIPFTLTVVAVCTATVAVHVHVGLTSPILGGHIWR